MKIRCFATPNDLLPGDLDGAAAIVIDTLRMTSVAARGYEQRLLRAARLRDRRSRPRGREGAPTRFWAANETP